MSNFGFMLSYRFADHETTRLQVATALASQTTSPQDYETTSGYRPTSWLVVSLSGVAPSGYHLRLVVLLSRRRCKPESPTTPKYITSVSPIRGIRDIQGWGSANNVEIWFCRLQTTVNGLWASIMLNSCFADYESTKPQVATAQPLSVVCCP